VILAIGLAGEIFLGCDLRAEDCGRRKFLDEGQQQLVERSLADLFSEKGDGVRPQLWSALSAVARHHEMERLVDQTESVDIARTHRPLSGSMFVQTVSKGPRRAKIREDHVAGNREQTLIQLAGLTHPPRDVELARRATGMEKACVVGHHLSKPSPSYRRAATRARARARFRLRA